MTTLVHAGDLETPPCPREVLRRRRRRAATTTEFGETLDAVGLSQSRVAKLFGISCRHVRRWRHGDRRVPPAVRLVINLLVTGAISIDQVEQAAIPIPARTNGAAKPEPLAPLLVAPARAQAAEAVALADSGLTVAEKVYALAPEACRWPCGDPRHPDFYFCGDPAVRGPYCAQHRTMAYVVREFREPKKIPRAFALRSSGQPNRISTKLSVPSYSPRP
jgi:hypothetical protein